MKSPENALTLVAPPELTASDASTLRDKAKQRFTDGFTDINLDCSSLGFIDSSGLGALISLQKLAAGRNGSLRLIRPQPAVIQILELTRLHRIFEIVPG
jgi:anti-sigma B factor antagonist